MSVKVVATYPPKRWPRKANGRLAFLPPTAQTSFVERRGIFPCAQSAVNAECLLASGGHGTAQAVSSSQDKVGNQKPSRHRPDESQRQEGHGSHRPWKKAGRAL